MSLRSKKGGYVIVARCVYDHPVVGWDANPIYFGAWLKLIQMTAWKTREQHGVELHRGQVIGSRRYLAKILKMTERQTRTFLDTLKRNGMVKTAVPANVPGNVPRNVPRVEVLSICNYNKYQDLSQYGVPASVPANVPTNVPYIENNIKTNNNTPPADAEENWIVRDEINAAYEAYIAKAERYGLVKSKLTSAARDKLKGALKREGLKTWLEAMDMIDVSPHLQGKNDWRPALDWFCNRSNFDKTIQGNYAKTGATSQGGKPRRVDHSDQSRGVTPEQQMAANYQSLLDIAAAPLEFPEADLRAEWPPDDVDFIMQKRRELQSTTN